jgi:hypothetical protein
MVRESKIRCSVVSFSHAPQISKFKFSLLAKTHLVWFILDHEAVSKTSSMDPSQVSLQFILIYKAL